MSSGPPRKRIRQISGQSVLSFQRKEDKGEIGVVFWITFFEVPNWLAGAMPSDKLTTHESCLSGRVLVRSYR